MPLLAINHHYFRVHEPGNGIYPTTPSGLRNAVEKILKAGWRLGSQRDVMDFISGELKENDFICVLTFDDGLKEQIDAVSYLKELGGCAVCFVPTAPLMEQRVLDVHKLQMIRSVVQDEQLVIDLDRRFSFSRTLFDDESLAVQYRYDAPLSRRVKYFLNFVLSVEQRVDWIAEYFVTKFGSDSAAAASLYMEKSDLEWLANKHLLGSHGHAHLPLATLTTDQILYELEASFNFLIDYSGRAPLGISYPFGGKTAVSAKVFELAKIAGYRYGFTMERGINHTNATEDFMALKRIDTNDLDAWVSQVDRFDK